MTERGPRPIGDILSQLMARRGYARVRSGDSYALAWSEAAGEELAGSTRATQVRRGALEVIVTNSLILQEIVYQKQGLLARLASLLPDEKISDLRLRVGRIA